jgi:hypothetical protein
MIALITAKNPNNPSQSNSKSFDISVSPLSPKSPLVAKWLLDDNSRLYCKWVKE